MAPPSHVRAPMPTPSRASVASVSARPSVTAPTTQQPVMPATSPLPQGRAAVISSPAPRSGIATPLSSRFSSMSVGSWSIPSTPTSSPPSPSPLSQHPRSMVELMMPSHPIRQSPAPVAPTSPRSGPSSSQIQLPGLTRFDILGPRTHAVLEATNLSPSLHRTLRELVLSRPQSMWYGVLIEELRLSEGAAQQLFVAMEEDVPLA